MGQIRENFLSRIFPVLQYLNGKYTLLLKKRTSFLSNYPVPMGHSLTQTQGISILQFSLITFEKFSDTRGISPKCVCFVWRRIYIDEIDPNQMKLLVLEVKHILIRAHVGRKRKDSVALKVGLLQASFALA